MSELDKTTKRYRMVGERKFVETHCIFCDMSYWVPEELAKDYLCIDCKEHFEREMQE